MLYGYSPCKDKADFEYKFRPIMSLKAKIAHIKKVSKGQYIGYNKNYCTKRDSIIATIPLGYADGYSYLLSNKGKVIVKSQYANIVGNICMDSFMIDVTDINDVNLYDDVILIGSHEDKKIDAYDISKLINTTPYEIICMVSKRVPRIYLKNNELIQVRNYV